MGKEIERKFLVKNEKFPKENGIRIEQGFLSTDKDRVVRIRRMGEKAFITIKSGSNSTTRLEFEYAIPQDDANILLNKVCYQPAISKTRYRIPENNMVWEVDVFDGENKGLIIAEVELKEEDQKIVLPSWIGKEVTGVAKYYNANLIKNPYSKWGKK